MGRGISIGVSLQPDFNTPGAPAVTPLTIFPSGSDWIGWYRGDQYAEGGGAGTGVTTWGNMQSGSNNWTNQVGTMSALATGGPNSTPALDNGAAAWMKNGWTPTVPPFYYYAIIRQNAFVANATLIANTVSRAAVRNNTTSPNVFASNGTSSTNVAMTANTWYRLIANYSNSTNDFLQIGSNTTGTGTNFGANAGTTGLGLFGLSSGGPAISNGRIAELLILTRKPTGTELTQLDAYSLARYGNSVQF